MKVIAPTALLSMQAAAVLAAPFVAKNALVTRQGSTKIYENADGFAEVEYGDGKLNYGARVPSTVLDIIKDECGELSCNPSGGLGFSTRVITSGFEDDKSYTVSVEGSFNSAGERGSKEQLLELAKLAFQEVYNSGVATLREDVKYVTGGCPASQTNGCATQGSAYTDQWESTDHVHVRIQNEDGTIVSFLNVGVAQDDASAGTGICAALGAAATGLGFVNAAAAAGISLASIACGTL